MAAYVEMDQVTKTYQMGEVTIKAADGISFQVEKGEFVVVVGPSGAGKTTRQSGCKSGCLTQHLRIHSNYP